MKPRSRPTETTIASSYGMMRRTSLVKFSTEYTWIPRERNMVLQKRTTDIDGLWQLIHQADNDDIRYELIDGEIFEMSPPGLQHGSLASEISRISFGFSTKTALWVSLP